MVSKELNINCPLGLNVEPAGALCKEAVNFKSIIRLEYQGGEANAKSMLSLLGAALGDGDAIRIVCEGSDEEKALEVISGVLEHRLG